MLVHRPAVLAAILVTSVALTFAPLASATWFGSSMRGAANAAYGCESALILGPIGGVELAPTNQRSCTYRHGGYVNSLKPTSLVPASGRIKRIQVKSGPNPARLRLTILTGSSRVSTIDGTDLPGTYTCCTARYVGRAFRPKANAVTTLKANVPVFDVRSKAIQNRIHSTDGVALSAVGPGTLPLHLTDAVGNIAPGAPLVNGWYPRTGVGEPRVDGYTMAGIDLLFRWDFRR